MAFVLRPAKVEAVHPRLLPHPRLPPSPISNILVDEHRRERRAGMPHEGDAIMARIKNPVG